MNLKQKGSTMTIDFSKMNEGDKVKFKSGGEVVIEAISGQERYNGIYSFIFRGYSGDFVYNPDGRIGSMPSGDSPFDIVEIIEKPFDWNTVENGMAFEYIIEGDPEPGLYYYVAPCLESERSHWFSSQHNPRIAKTWSLPASYLKRRPEYDLTPR